MTPLRISAQLLGCGEYAEWTPDIASLLEREWLDRRGLLQPDPSPDSIVVPDLPIAKLEIDGYWQWACSSPVYTYQTESTVYIAKRWDMGLEYPVNWGRKSKRVQTDGGNFKSWRKPVFIRNPTAIHWYTVGDIGAVRSLLEPVTSLGAKRGQGFGQVSQWDVVEVEHDYSLMCDGRLTAPIPTRFIEKLGLTLDGNPIRRWSVHAPRRHPTTTELFAMPTLTQRTDD